MGWMRVVNGEPPAHDVIQRPAVQHIFKFFSILTFVVLCVATRLPLKLKHVLYFLSELLFVPVGVLVMSRCQHWVRVASRT